MNTVSYNRNSIAPQRVAFKADPKKIYKAIAENDILCPGKEGFLLDLMKDVKSIQKEYSKYKYRGSEDSFKYYLNKQNNLSPDLQGTKLDKKVSNLDEELHDGEFSCGSESGCSCGKGNSLGGFAVKLFKMLDLENPEYITVKRQPKFWERLFTKKSDAAK